MDATRPPEQLELAPLDRDAPKVQNRIVEAYEAAQASEPAAPPTAARPTDTPSA